MLVTSTRKNIPTATSKSVDMSELRELASGFSNSELQKLLNERQTTEKEEQEESFKHQESVSEDVMSTMVEESDEMEVGEIVSTKFECLKFAKSVLQEKAAIEYEMLNEIPEKYTIETIVGEAQKLYDFLTK